MLTKAQSTIIGAGYRQVVERSQQPERIVSINVHYRGDGSVWELKQKLRAVRDAIAVYGMRISASEGVMNGTAFGMSEEAIEERIAAEVERRVEAMRDKYEQQVADLQAWAETMQGGGEQPSGGVTLRDFAKAQGISYSTAYRAMQDGRLQARVLSKGVRSTYMVYPETYIPKRK